MCMFLLLLSGFCKFTEAIRDLYVSRLLTASEQLVQFIFNLFISF